MPNITIIGAGHVGLVTGACFAQMGHQVTCIDVDEEKIELLQRGTLPIYEPDLQELVDNNTAAARLRFTTSYGAGLENSEFIFLAVNTPTGTQAGAADLHYLISAVRSVAHELDHYAIIVTKSTVPVGTGDMIAEVIRAARPDAQFDIVSNPEFLREGSGVYDARYPERVVVGSHNEHAARSVAALYLGLRVPILLTDLRTAEMIKYASNAFLATKISFINQVAQICERLGADVKEVATGMGFDPRIGRSFLNAGLGYGGSCFPKDVLALAHMAQQAGIQPQLLQAVMEINRQQRFLVIEKLLTLLDSLHGCTIGVLGLAFKPETDDMREAPSIDIIHQLTQHGAQVKVYDPAAMQSGRIALEAAGVPLDGVTFCQSCYEVAREADALVLVTEWRAFLTLDMPRVLSEMRRSILIDGRNALDAVEMERLGFTYRGIGTTAALSRHTIPAPLLETVG
ncbi:MAG: UDP-glucose/GDP-mannose dehydrogenase family protein [Ktedonobacteraceae bacterium]|nr:UDP-glucose/GDP-mannose dehydrogenase family protein [Ktedonobacteraceae bacterium]